MKENIIVTKSEDFAVRIVNLFKLLMYQRHESVLSKQLLKCGTSIGANVAEAQEAQSISDFIAKLYISIKECRETQYWLRILHRSNYLSTDEYQSITKDADEIKAILTAIIKSTKSNKA